ncbi:MAG: YihY/virulence factor BrkB family protein [Streptosporangiaceae bacterium]|nr:YihY/virulence factor BrkB family protein [Streptosporangiaceae bacterium]
MNPVERTVRRIDAFQQRHTPTAFIFGVVKKYGDDNGGVLASNLAYSGFISLFPLLLILITILGLVASADPAVKTDVINAVSDQVPIIGHTLTENVHQLQRNSVIGLIVGLLGLIWGATGLAQAGLFTMEQVWNVPGPGRPGFFPRLLRALIFLGLLGIAVIVTTLLASLNTYGHNSAWLVAGAEIVAGAANVGMFIAAFRILTPKGVPTRALLPGAAIGGIVYTMLQVLGTFLVHHFLHSDSAYGVFGTVLGLIAWIYLAVQITVYAAEINVVLARQLWPRSIVQPPLTDADRHSLALQALQNQRRNEQQVEVKFTGADADSDQDGPVPPKPPRTPDEVKPPARS